MYFLITFATPNTKTALTGRFPLKNHRKMDDYHPKRNYQLL